MGSDEQPRPTYAEKATITSFFQPLYVTIAGIGSAVIPEAAEFALRLKWFILILSLPPPLVHHIYRPKDYFGVHRAAGIWVCNALLLAIAYFFNKMCLNRNIADSNDVTKFVSENPNSNIVVFPIMGSSMVSFIVLLFSLLVGIASGSLKDAVHRFVKSPCLALLVLIGTILTCIFLVPVLPFKIDTWPASLSAVYRAQLLVSALLVATTLTFPAYLKLRLSSPLGIFTAVSCVLHGMLCLASDLHIQKDPFIISGAFTTSCDLVGAAYMVLQMRFCAENSAAAENYEMAAPPENV